MEQVRKLETIIAGWYKNVPHLPVAGQKWIAQNAWWLILIWVILSAMGVASILFVTFIAGTLLAGLGGAVGAALSGLAFAAVVVSLLFSIVELVLGTMAIAPLKALQKRGWTLIFVIELLTLVALAITFLFDFNFFGLVWGVLFTAVWLYFLFEIRSYFVGTQTRKKVAAKPKKTDEADK